MTLFSALREGDVNAVKYWLECGESANGSDCAGKSYLRIAVCSRNFEIVKLLVQHGAKCRVDNCFYDIDEFHHAIYLGLANIAFYLFLNGNPLNVDSAGIVKEEKLIVSLARAKKPDSAQCRLNLLKLLIAHGANLDEKLFKASSAWIDTMLFHVLNNRYRDVNQHMIEMIVFQNLYAHASVCFERVLNQNYGYKKKFEPKLWL